MRLSKQNFRAPTPGGVGSARVVVRLDERGWVARLTVALSTRRASRSRFSGGLWDDGALDSPPSGVRESRIVTDVDTEALAPTGMPLPRDVERPLFVYGLLQPGELAHEQIAPFVESAAAATAPGRLWVRDGLPLLELKEEVEEEEVDAAHPEVVYGHVVTFRPAKRDDAWRAVCLFEPPKQYSWGVVEVEGTSGETCRANVLLGRKLRRGITGEPVHRWNAQHDPVLNVAPEVANSIARDALAGNEPSRPSPNWEMYFRMQAAYLLLWSVVERYTALRFGPALDPYVRVRRLDADELFRSCAATVGIEPRSVVDSRDPSKRVSVTPEGENAARHYYQVRSNLAHRGKGAYVEFRLVKTSFNELHQIMRLLLEHHFPDAPDDGMRTLTSATPVVDLLGD